MKAKLWLVPALVLLSAFAQAQEKFKVGYIRVMDDAGHGRPRGRAV